MNVRTPRRRWLTLRATCLAAAALVATTLVGATASPQPAGATPAVTSLRSATVDDGWQVDAPASMGVDETVLQGARDYAFQADRHTQGVVVVRGGKIVSEWYAPGEGPRSWTASWSVAKSFTSALIGIAIGEGKIPSVDVPMSTYFPEWAHDARGAITLRQVLHMESGLAWNEDYDPTSAGASNVIDMVVGAANELDYAASRPAEVAPGTRWNYSSGDSMLLSRVLSQATGMPADEYARQKLFGPLGIQQVEWWRDAGNNTLTYCCLDMTSRGLARMGLLYLHGGNWNGQQIVPASWVQDSITPTALSNGHYGYQWWVMQLPNVAGDVFFANGFDGQFIYVIPSLDMVVVRNGDYVKSECAPVADPNLFAHYPPYGLVAGQGTTPPASWSAAAFLAPVVASVVGPEPGGSDTNVPGPETPRATRQLDGQAMVPCPTPPTEPSTPTSQPTPTTVPVSAPVARAVSAQPTFTG